MLLESDSRYARADSITAHRRALRTADFDPLPDDGKECFLVGWSSKTAVSDTEIRSWQSSPSLTASSNTGILTKFAPALDIDILDQHAADAVEELIHPRLNGMVLVRTGLPPKRLIPFRTDKPFRKIRIRFVDTKEKLEFLGDGQQYAAFGIHPDTQQPYTWRGGEPGTVPRSALPEIDEASARALINAAAELLVTRFGYRRVDTNKKYLMTCCASPGHDPVVAQDCTTALNQMDPVDWQGNRERWLELLIACKAVGISLQAFMAWSIRDEIYAGEEDEIARQWRHVAPRHGGAFWAALKAREIKIERHRHEVLLPSLSKVPSLAYVLDRFSRIANPSEQDLFSHACWLADVAQRHGLRAPRQYMRLIETRAAESSLWELLGADGCRRSIANGFAHVELKYGAQGVQR